MDYKKRLISIHALRGEGDVEIMVALIHGLMISIHALRGEGDKGADGITPTIGISIHALRGEGDLDGLISPIAILNFNPRPPWGGRPMFSRRKVG